MDVLAAELVNANEAVKDDLETAFEQCVFCLYGHPNKKAKARHLFDHNAPPVRFCLSCLSELCFLNSPF